MADIHIEDFFKDAALILNQLYHLFPRKGAVFVEDISGPDSPDEYGLHCPRHEACFGTMLWLAEEGFLRYESTIRREAIDQSVLSREAFLMLSSLCNPALLDCTESEPLHELPYEQRTHINLIRHLLKHGTSTQLADIMHRLFAA
ncbi:MAG: hypothetical protein H7A00_02600 [Hahellaceae bacterium]|nr:hypothetical protein [Hahellaceae bacterium]